MLPCFVYSAALFCILILMGTRLDEGRHYGAATAPVGLKSI